jgi:DnaK suppressor protein
VAKHAPMKKTPAKKAPASKPAPAATVKPAARKSTPVAPTKAGKAAKTAPAAKPITSVKKPAKAIPTVSRPVAPEPPRAPMPIPVPVPTNGKPRKNQAGLTSKELEHFRDLLFQKRRELVGDMGQMEREALRSASGSNLSNLPLHMADMGTDNYEQEFTLGLVEKERNLLREINSALAKIMDGTYGICEGTGKPISKVRLEAQPWARFSIEYQNKMEKGFIR